jgi:hypothetical protein
MKRIVLFFVLMYVPSFGQDCENDEKKLQTIFSRIEHWSSSDTAFAYDSLDRSNTTFFKLILKVTASNPKSLQYDFAKLKKDGLRIVTSEDGNFRIYSWDDGTGGTMRSFMTVFQYKNNNKTISVKGNEALYTQINDVVSQGKKFYLAQNVVIGSSALSYHRVNVFSIDSGKLNDKAVLIKTKTGIKNGLGYEVDLSSAANRDNENVPDYQIGYDKISKTISIPVVLTNGRVTNKKIKYRFNDLYFVKIE